MEGFPKIVKDYSVHNSLIFHRDQVVHNIYLNFRNFFHEDLNLDDLVPIKWEVWNLHCALPVLNRHNL